MDCLKLGPNLLGFKLVWWKFHIPLHSFASHLDILEDKIKNKTTLQVWPAHHACNLSQQGDGSP